MSVLLKYTSHMCPLEMECPNLHEAMINAYSVSNRGQGIPSYILDGQQKYSFEDMKQYWAEHNFAGQVEV